MSQPPPNHDWSGWTVAGVAVLGIIGTWLAGRRDQIFGAGKRAQFLAYLQERDRVSETRHTENVAKLDNIVQRVSRIEGRLDQS